MRSTNASSSSSPLHKARRQPADATVRIGGTLAIPQVLRSLGADPAVVLAEAGLDLALFDNPDHLISYAARGRLLDHCVARTGCRHFGLLVGQHNGLHSLGLLGLLAKYSPDVGSALQSLVRFTHVHVRGAAVDLAHDGDVVRLSYGGFAPGAAASEQVGAGAVASLFNIMRDLCGPQWLPREARFAHREPDDVGPYRRFFQARLRFDAAQYGLAFAADWLTRPLPASDPELRRLLLAQVKAIEARHPDDLPTQVIRVLRAALLTRHASANQIAALFSMRSRTLNRRLNDFGTSFRALLDDSRFEISRQAIEDSDMDMCQIATMLDYADASAFTRAFRRWSGTTPTAWRAQHLSAAAPSAWPAAVPTGPG